jgi:hypothetical protein
MYSQKGGGRGERHGTMKMFLMFLGKSSRFVLSHQTKFVSFAIGYAYYCKLENFFFNECTRSFYSILKKVLSLKDVLETKASQKSYIRKDKCFCSVGLDESEKNVILLTTGNRQFLFTHLKNLYKIV